MRKVWRLIIRGVALDLISGPLASFTFLQSSIKELKNFKMAPSPYKSCVLTNKPELAPPRTPIGVRLELTIYYAELYFLKSEIFLWHRPFNVVL